MEYDWRFYFNMAHLTDTTNHTACNRSLKSTDLPSDSWDGESNKCGTCKKYFVKHGFQIIVKEGSEEKTK